MRVINVKKLIISTLIFLFSTFNTDLLADAQVPPPVVQESVFLQEAESVLLTAPNILTAQQAIVRTSYLAPGQAILLMQQQASHKEALVVATAYSDQPVAFTVLPGQPAETSLHKFLAPVLQPTSLFPKIFSAQTHPGTLLVMPDWRVEGAYLSAFTLGFLFYSCYFAFRGYRQLKGKEVHTHVWTASEAYDPFASSVVQCLAANLAQLEQLVFHTDQNELVDQVNGFLKEREGQSVALVLKELLL